MQHMHDAAFHMRNAIKALEAAGRKAPTGRSRNGLQHLTGAIRRDLKAIHQAHDYVAAEARREHKETMR